MNPLHLSMAIILKSQEQYNQDDNLDHQTLKII